MNAKSCIAAVLLPLAIAQLSAEAVAQSASPALAQHCDEASAAILRSFDSDDERIAQMLALADDCADTGIYEARLAQLYAETRDFEEGEAVAIEALALNSPYENEILVAQIHLALGPHKLDEATQYAAVLASNYPDWTRSLVTAGRVLQLSRQHAAAIQFLETANAGEETGEAWLYLSGLYFSNGQYEDALQARARALQLDPSGMRFTEFVVVGVMSLKELGRADEARAMLDRHLEAVPHASERPLTASIELLLAPDLLDQPVGQGIVTTQRPAFTTDLDELVEDDGEDEALQRNMTTEQRLIEQTFERNKGAIFALYNRALRQNPELEGRVVLRIRIQPGGQVDLCEIVEETLGDPELLARMCQRISLIRFEDLEISEPMTVTKPFEFFPA